MTLKELDEATNHLLPKIPKIRQSYSFNFAREVEIYLKANNLSVETQAIARVIRYMAERQLIKIHTQMGLALFEAPIELLTFGLEVEDKGGWIKYKKQKEENESMEEKIKHLTIAQLEGNIFQIKWWWVIALISAALAVAATLIVDAIKKALE